MAIVKLRLIVVGSILGILLILIEVVVIFQARPKETGTTPPSEEALAQVAERRKQLVKAKEHEQRRDLAEAEYEAARAEHDKLTSRYDDLTARYADPVWLASRRNLQAKQDYYYSVIANEYEGSFEDYVKDPNKHLIGEEAIKLLRQAEELSNEE